MLRRRVQCRGPATLLRVASAPALEAEPPVSSSRAAAALCSGVDLQLLVARDDVDQRASLYQKSRSVRPSEERGQVERRETVLRRRGDEPGVGFEQLVNPVRTADGGRLEDVERSGSVARISSMRAWSP